MKALLCTRLGTPDDLELADIPEPTAGPGEAIVRVEAAALNFFDTLIIAGKYQTKPALPFSPSAEFAGRVESLGAGASGVSVGDRVLGYIRFGAARERIAVATDRLVKVPPELDAEHAAGLCVTYGTTLHALKDRARMRKGETLAVLGASGGVGLAAIEIGKLMGARVIACASSEEKLAFARKHGADEGIDYAKDDLKEALRRLTDGRGVDVVYDPVGGVYAEAALRSIAWLGRYPGDRLCHRRDPQAAAQSGAVARLRRARRALGLMDRARSRRAPRQYRAAAGLGRAGQFVDAHPRGLSARRGAGRAQGDRDAQSDGQGDLAAVIAISGV